MRLSRPFIRLPWNFDVAQVQQEIAALPPGAWMAHPSRLQGNSAAALISKDGLDNDEFAGRMNETPHLARCPTLRRVIASFGMVVGRSRLMRLAPGSEVSTHVDFNYHWYSRVRIHIPITTNDAVRFYSDYLPAGNYQVIVEDLADPVGEGLDPDLGKFASVCAASPPAVQWPKSARCDGEQHGDQDDRRSKASRHSARVAQVKI